MIDQEQITEQYLAFRNICMGPCNNLLHKLEEDFRRLQNYNIQSYIFHYDEMYDVVLYWFTHAEEIEDYELCATMLPIIKQWNLS